jgi:hypothetical protein
LERSGAIMKKNKKRYVKPEVKKNKPMVNVTFASGPAIPNTVAAPGTTPP